MCDCCEPTSDSPDPVVLRLEGEVAAAWESRNAWKLNAEASSKSCNRLRDERDEARKQADKYREERDDNAHVIVEAGVIPGCDYHCRCEVCRRVVKAMDEAGFICALETDERWWDESEVKP